MLSGGQEGGRESSGADALLGGALVMVWGGGCVGETLWMVGKSLDSYGGRRTDHFIN